MIAEKLLEVCVCVCGGASAVRREGVQGGYEVFGGAQALQAWRGFDDTLE